VDTTLENLEAAALEETGKPGHPAGQAGRARDMRHAAHGLPIYPL